MHIMLFLPHTIIYREKIKLATKTSFIGLITVAQVNSTNQTIHILLKHQPYFGLGNSLHGAGTPLTEHQN